MTTEDSMRAAAKTGCIAPLRFELPPLPYAYDALQPVISHETLELHHDRHHRKYIEATNQLLSGSDIQADSLEEVVRASSGKLFNNAAQSWNHDFYWRSLVPRGGKPSPGLMKMLQAD